MQVHRRRFRFYLEDVLRGNHAKLILLKENLIFEPDMSKLVELKNLH